MQVMNDKDLFGHSVNSGTPGMPTIKDAKCVKLQIGTTTIDLASANLLLQTLAIAYHSPDKDSGEHGRLALGSIMAQQSLLARLINGPAKDWSAEYQAAIENLGIVLDNGITYRLFGCKIVDYAIAVDSNGSGLLMEQLAVTFNHMVVSFPVTV